MNLPLFYEVDLNWKENRKGEISSPALSTSITIVTPPEFPKGIEGEWSPEHLFIGAVVSCFMTTFLSIADNSKLTFLSFFCKAKGKLEMVEGKLMISEILIETEVNIPDEGSRDKTERIIQKTESNCLISNSTRSKIIIQANIKTPIEN